MPSVRGFFSPLIYCGKVLLFLKVTSCPSHFTRRRKCCRNHLSRAGRHSKSAAIMKPRLHVVVDPMGWLCISAVFGIWLYNSFFVPELVLLPHYREGHIPWILVICYYAASALCIAALFRASTADPGHLPTNPNIPHSERQHWEMCNKCNLMRPRRSHHCSRCGHCVRRMDHHCPWINNCVGEDNHWLFLQLCFYTQVLSGFTLVLDFCQYYYFQPLTQLDQWWSEEIVAGGAGRSVWHPLEGAVVRAAPKQTGAPERRPLCVASFTKPPK
ncbi:palmitoyltransferase ZDHHC21 isoform X3 [Corythoichthys intestinalis]|uniref:palmitoyltransferase ZDHHC21 isoform X3 n=1 Tax=Corythoichthys intestinalis TaxID=161448 RepID=UPI0025A6183D|nr:palmitoyltransferase ZDHHC21 isoform X3 [Corythoichthys intestinalis]